MANSLLGTPVIYGLEHGTHRLCRSKDMTFRFVWEVYAMKQWAAFHTIIARSKFVNRQKRQSLPLYSSNGLTNTMHHNGRLFRSEHHTQTERVRLFHKSFQSLSQKSNLFPVESIEWDVYAMIQFAIYQTFIARSKLKQQIEKTMTSNIL